MINPIRRNRNIGTAKQGHGQDNKLVVPFPSVEMKSFFERLGEYKTIEKIVKGHKFRFIIEKTRKNSFHACTIEDIEQLLLQIPKEDYGDLELIILRQPTRKEENLKPVWGRLIYSYEFEKDFFPAVILEAVDLERTFKWTKKLDIDSQKELKRLKEDGHKIVTEKRYYESEYELDAIRATQLYRTLPHEFGHFVHYLEMVERPATEEEEYEEWEKRWNNYHNLPKSEKESFAHLYADKLKENLEEKEIIPFDRILNETELIGNGLDLEDFKKAQ
ncbi:hypothetical protein ACE193_05990 [Bernardetia sp. OM2101]|uniref:hypothetical protein n=1 Tax=Bernardetia sp. OM2101 TaxID=3344876 RepID=UPI0035D03114